MQTVIYTLLFKPNGQFPCKRKYIYGAETDAQASQMADEYASKKKATIYSLTKEVREVFVLIKND